MGWNDENFEPLVYDHETTGREDVEALIETPSAPSNYKDEQAIADYKADKLKTLIDRAATDIWLNRITTMGIWVPSLGLTVVTCQNLDEEKTALAALAVVISNNGHRRRIVTFAGLQFDLLNVIVRARIHGLHFPLTLSDVVPAWKHASNDLMEVMTFQGKVARHSLDFYCKVLGIDSTESDEVKALKGSDMPRLAAEGRYDLIAGHCRHDVVRTAKLAQRMDVIRES